MSMSDGICIAQMWSCLVLGFQNGPLVRGLSPLVEFRKQSLAYNVYDLTTHSLFHNPA